MATRGHALLLLFAAFALRCWDFGNPVIHVDEQWYLLVGDRLLHGAIPYVDLWDRKPVGLFLLFAGFRLLPGDGIIAYQVAATLFAAATAIVVDRAGRLLGAASHGRLAAGALYLVGLSLLGGRGGQAPVFYNLFVALAALLVLGLPRRLEQSRPIVARGALACLLAGIAIQIKYTAAPEAAFIGLAHLWALRRRGDPLPRIMAAALLWLVAGLLPTLAAAGWYAAHGQFAPWWFANFASIALRPGYPADQLAMRLLGIGAQLAPLALCVWLGWRLRSRDDAGGAETRLALAWLAAALLGFVAIGTFFDHYALPLLAPLCVAAAPALGRSGRALVATLGLALLLFGIERSQRPQDQPGVRHVAEWVAANSAGRGCPYVFIGDTVTYLLAHACTPTAYAFPNLLAYTTERGATGIDEAAEVGRVLAARPPVIVTSTRRLSIWNPVSLVQLKTSLACNYRLIFTAPRDDWRTAVYLRRDLPLRRPAPSR